MGEWLTFTFALTGRREWGHGTQGVALGSGLVGLSARAWPLIIGLQLAGPSAREGRPKNRPPHFASKVSYNAGAANIVIIPPKKIPFAHD